jgi:hypothetical protein
MEDVNVSDDLQQLSLG